MVSQRIPDSGDVNVEELLARGVTHCRLTCQKDVEVMRKGVKALIKLKPKERKKWACGEVHRGQPDLGLLRRVRRGKYAEKKWFFHFNLRLRDALRANGINPDDHAEFLSACERIYTAASLLARRTAEALGVPCPKSDARLRMVWYDPVKKLGMPVARGHWDRNSLTVHIAESHAGLTGPARLPEKYKVKVPKMRRFKRAHKDLVHLFVAAKLTYLDPKRFFSLWHEGIMTTLNEWRWALVLFWHHDMDMDVPEDFEAKDHDEVAKVIRAARG